MRCLATLLACAACTGDPSAPHLARGNVLVNNGKREEAAAEYREAARLAPKRPLPLERLGDVLYDLGKKDEALAAYREAATRDPGAFTARIGAARVLTDQGKLADAREELTAALRGQPTNLYLLLSRGNLHQRAGTTGPRCSRTGRWRKRAALSIGWWRLPRTPRRDGSDARSGSPAGATAPARRKPWRLRTYGWRRRPGSVLPSKG